MTVSYQQRPYAVPGDATEVILVRHGASVAALAGEPFELLEGRGDPPLSDVGERQAEAVGERLSGEPLAAIFTSTLRRTQQTAAPLVGHVAICPTITFVRRGGAAAKTTYGAASEAEIVRDIQAIR